MCLYTLKLVCCLRLTKVEEPLLAELMRVCAPTGVGFVATETEFESEQEAIREVDPRRSRVWKIKNPHSRNSVTGEPPMLLLFVSDAPNAHWALLGNQKFFETQHDGEA